MYIILNTYRRMRWELVFALLLHIKKLKKYMGSGDIWGRTSKMLIVIETGDGTRAFIITFHPLFNMFEISIIKLLRAKICWLSNRKMYVFSQKQTRMFRTALFITVSNWKQPMCPSTVEWINKWWIFIKWNEYGWITDMIEVTTRQNHTQLPFIQKEAKLTYGTGSRPIVSGGRDWKSKKDLRGDDVWGRAEDGCPTSEQINPSSTFSYSGPQGVGCCPLTGGRDLLCSV